MVVRSECNFAFIRGARFHRKDALLQRLGGYLDEREEEGIRINRGEITPEAARRERARLEEAFTQRIQHHEALHSEYDRCKLTGDKKRYNLLLRLDKNNNDFPWFLKEDLHIL